MLIHYVCERHMSHECLMCSGSSMSYQNRLASDLKDLQRSEILLKAGNAIVPICSTCTTSLFSWGEILKVNAISNSCSGFNRSLTFEDFQQCSIFVADCSIAIRIRSFIQEISHLADNNIPMYCICRVRYHLCHYPNKSTG